MRARGGEPRGGVASAQQPEGRELPAREAYALWAPGYDRETAVSALEERVVSDLTPPLEGRSLLDAGCGTGRRLLRAPGGPVRAVGVDLVPEMIAAGRAERRRGGAALVVGDFCHLPFRDALFDVLWCRLAMGHVPETDEVYRELARVSAPGAFLVVSDFHPEAVAAGHARTFHDARGRLHAVEHHVHTVADHRRCAGAAGWTPGRILHVPAGSEERPFYERAGRLEQFRRDADLPLVLVMCFHR